MSSIDEKLRAYTTFFQESTAGFEEIGKIFARLVPKALQILESHGNLDEDENASEGENAQLSQLRILERDFQGYMKSYAEKIGALRDELNQKIEFAQVMIEAMEENG